MDGGRGIHDRSNAEGRKESAVICDEAITIDDGFKEGVVATTFTSLLRFSILYRPTVAFFTASRQTASEQEVTKLEKVVFVRLLLRNSLAFLGSQDPV
jgi:hypothetical protein